MHQNQNELAFVLDKTKINVLQVSESGEGTKTEMPDKMPEYDVLIRRNMTLLRKPGGLSSNKLLIYVRLDFSFIHKK